MNRLILKTTRRPFSRIINSPCNLTGTSSSSLDSPCQPITRSFALKMTTENTNTPPPAPWRDDFKKHIESMAVPTFVLSTLHHHQPPQQEDPTPSSPLTKLPITPRARTCIYRGLWATLLPNDRNPAPRNPPLFESDLPVFTTDARMEKAGEIFTTTSISSSSSSSPSSTPDTSISGGGGPVEAVFWAADHGTQWRIRGTAWILGPDIDDPDSSSNNAPATRIKSLLRERMRRSTSSRDTQQEEKEWTFTREITAHFGNLSPGMRGTFRNPPPGRPVASGSHVLEPGLGLGQKVDDLEDPLARRNFRVVVIVPVEVDRADLSDPEHPRRWLYVFRSAGSDGEGEEGSGPQMPGGVVNGEWEIIEVWP